jgi:translation initiation factor IF-2
MTKIRINDLARELEVKSKAILDVLLEVGVTEKKTHSSSVEVDEAEKIRRYFTTKSSSAVSRERTAPGEIKPKLDLSKISKPGDVFKLLKEKELQQQHPPIPSRPAVATAPPPAIATPPKPASVAVAPPAVQEKPVVVTRHSRNRLLLSRLRLPNLRPILLKRLIWSRRQPRPL